MYKLLTLVIPPLVVYLTFVLSYSFITWSSVTLYFDIRDWDSIARLLYFIVTLLSCVITFGVSGRNKYYNKHSKRK